MVSKEEPGGSHSSLFVEDGQVDGGTHPFKFINSKRGKKVLVLDGYIFHFHSKFRTTYYFKCSHKSKGCGAGINLKNWNEKHCTFDSYQVTNSEHLNHLPDPEKIKKKEKQNKVVLEKAQVDLKSPEFLNSKHVCLFCFSALPSSYLSSCSLETVVPYGHDDLSILLDNPTKNSQAFDLLCSLLNVRWRRGHECRNFDQTITLPLCLKCQNLYQEVFQLHVQIRELEVLINKRIKVIRGLVEKSGESESIDIGETQLALLGLDSFRRKVKDANFNQYGSDVKEKDNSSTSATTTVNAANPTVAKIEPEVGELASEQLHIPIPNLDESVVKQEVNSEEGPPPEDYYFDEPSWMQESVREDEEIENNEDELPSPKAKVTPKRKRSTRLAAQRASERVSATLTSDNDEDDKTGGDNDNYVSNASESSDTDDEDKITEIKKPSKLRLSSASISRPIRYRQKTYSKPTSSRPLSCNLCSKILLGTKYLNLHYSQDHPDKKRYTCKFCPKEYPEFRDVITHQRIHTGEKPFKCPHCPFSTHQRCSLPQHISNKHTNKHRSKTSEIHPCPVPDCSSQFSSISILNNHLVSSHGQAPSLKFYKRSGKPIKVLTCHLCSAKVQGHGPFLQHYKEFHPTEKRFTCKFCPAYFPYIRGVLNHQRRHTGETRPHKCDHDQCPKTFSTISGLRYHKFYSHSQRPLQYTCAKCPKTFPSRSFLNAHIAYKHTDTVTFCKMCGKAFRRANAFSSHNKKIHQGTAKLSEPIKDLESVPLEELDVTLGITSDKDQRVKCHICWKLIISDKLFIQMHFNENHKDHKGTMFDCHLCGKKFNRYRYCVDHTIRKHTNQPKSYQCDKCPSSFYSGTELDKHQLSHVPMEERKKDHVCDLCGMGLCSLWALYYHRKKHEEEGKAKVKWVCDQCGKSYTEKRGLEHHKKVVHRKELKWQCGKCDKAFALRSLLKRHERNHLGYKAYKCGMCGVEFVHPTSRTRHEREVHGVGGGEKGRKRKTNKRRGVRGGDGGDMMMLEQNVLNEGV